MSRDWPLLATLIGFFAFVIGAVVGVAWLDRRKTTAIDRDDRDKWREYAEYRDKHEPWAVKAVPREADEAGDGT